MMFPRIHLNGTSAESLMAEYRAAHEAVSRAIEALAAVTVHGRDYYPIHAHAINTALAEHRARLAAMRQVASDLESIWADLDAQEAQRNNPRAVWIAPALPAVAELADFDLSG